ncbi:MAG: 16S rRNA (cytosine(967)-C(5))-methyltransferase RsmB [Clostridia bacterium]|nr:16S rRNA (cytosine(967)-C(5))-methyltransferase RsmB [Clostridia bacterium]
MKNNARRLALKILKQIEMEDQFSHITIKEMLKSSEVTDIDRRFITNIVYGVLENKLLLDYYIRKLSAVRYGKINKEILNILRMGIYQIAFMSKVPDSAAVNESVKLAKKHSPQYSGFVNGVLRSFIRSAGELELPDRNKNLVAYLSISYSHPEWLVEKWLEEFGEVFTEALLKSNNETPKLWLRVNTLKIQRDEFIDQLEAEGVKALASDWIGEAVMVENLNEHSIESLVGFNEGWFQVQDISSMFVAKTSSVKAGDVVVDVCAAPGGKTTHMAQLMGNSGQIIARDMHPQKLKLIEESAHRLGIDIIKTEVFDATHFDVSLKHMADIVLVDAPCSGFGIIRRKPDIKYNKSIEDLNALVEIQYKILETASEYAKPKGTVIYSTCTINADENIKMVEKFLEHHRNFKLSEISDLPGVQTNGTVMLFPNVDQTDGFFIAKMTKIE